MPTSFKDDSPTKDEAQMGEPLDVAYMVHRAQRGLSDGGILPGCMKLNRLTLLTEPLGGPAKQL
ncbi:hypothetical protein FRC12_018486 [Ceratobasidium sp. 428]|nr:hypothetical protein FRC12_018486 [Ceratobasidium sp. 428]